MFLIYSEASLLVWDCSIHELCLLYQHWSFVNFAVEAILESNWCVQQVIGCEWEVDKTVGSDRQYISGCSTDKTIERKRSCPKLWDENDKKMTRCVTETWSWVSLQISEAYLVSRLTFLNWWYVLLGYVLIVGSITQYTVAFQHTD